MSGISPGLVRFVPDFCWFGAGARTLIGCDYFICGKG